MKILKTRRGAIVAVLMASALAITGCTSGGTSGGGDAGAAQAKRPYVRAVNGDPMIGGLNSQLTNGTYPILFSAQIFDSLIRQSAEGKLTAGLATSWKVSDDGLTLTLEIRKGVKWHDGKPFTAEDVKFNFDEIVPLQAYGAELAKRIGSVEITGKNTVVVHLSQPYGPLLAAVSAQFMLPKHLYVGTNYVTNKANENPIGTGPMMFDTYTPGAEITLKKNPNYWGGKVKVDRAIFPVMADPNSRATALFAGEIDEATLDQSQQARVSTDKSTELLSTGSVQYYERLTFNAKSKYLEDAGVRRALFSALDRHEFVKTALAGIGTPANGFFPKSLDWANNPDVNFDKDFPFDADAINKTLDEAGFPRGSDGTRFTLKVLYINTLTDVAAIVQMAQSMLQKFGIKTQLIGVGGAVYSQKLYKEHNFDLAIVRADIGPDPSLGLSPWFVCNKTNAISANPSGICDPEIDAAAAVALATTDQKKRAAAFKTMQARAENLMYFAPIAWTNVGLNTISTSTWTGRTKSLPMTDRLPWLTMTPTK
jgi:peptide/nickel transport system substrate-binding protein